MRLGSPWGAERGEADGTICFEKKKKKKKIFFPLSMCKIFVFAADDVQ